MSSKPAAIRYSGNADPHKRGRDSSNKNTFAVLNAVQIQQPSKEPRTIAWFRSTVDNSSSKRALHSYAILTMPLVFSVTLSGRGGVTAAAIAKAILHFKTLLLAIPFRTVDNLDTGMQRPRGSPTVHQLLQSHQATSSSTARFRTAPFATSLSQNATSSFLPIFAEPRQCRYRCPLLLAEVPQKGLTETRN